MLRLNIAPQKERSELKNILNAKRERGFWGFLTRFISLKYVLPLVMCIGVGLVGFIVWFISNYHVNVYNDKIMQDYQTTKVYEIAARVKPFFKEILPILPQMVALVQAGASVPLMEAMMFSAMQNFEAVRFVDVTITGTERLHTGYTRNEGSIYGITQNITADPSNAEYWYINQTTGEHILMITTYPNVPETIPLYLAAVGKNKEISLSFRVFITFEGQQYEIRSIGLAQEVCLSPDRCIVIKLGLNTEDIAVMISNIFVSTHGFSFIMEPDKTVTADSLDLTISNRGLQASDYSNPLVKAAAAELPEAKFQQLLADHVDSSDYLTAHYTFTDSGQRYVVMYAPMIIARDEASESLFSMRFIVGTIILESDFVGFLQDINQKTALAVSLVTVGMGIVIALFTYAIMKAINFVTLRMSHISRLEFNMQHSAAQDKKKSASGMLQSLIKSVTPRSRETSTPSSPSSPTPVAPNDPISAIWEAYKHNENKSLLIFDELKDLVRDSVKTEIAVYCASCYTPKGVIKHVLDGNIPMTTGMEPRIMTVMFADIIGFTTLCETYPKKIALATSEFDETVSHIVQAHKGVIGTYNGDNIVAWWNAPDEVDGHPYHACTAALACVAELNAMNARLRAKGFPCDIQFGLGLSYGMMYVGNIGYVDGNTGEVRLHYTTIGDRVNIAARLESATREHSASILISEQMYEQVNQVPEFFFQKVGNLQLKGKKQDVVAYSLAPAPANVAASRRSGRFMGSSKGSSLAQSTDSNHPFGPEDMPIDI